jgi:hypothetical protein
LLALCCRGGGIRTPGPREGSPVFAEGIPLGQDRCNEPLYSSHGQNIIFLEEYVTTEGFKKKLAPIRLGFSAEFFEVDQFPGTQSFCISDFASVVILKSDG